jgi:F-type H+/Na+-transporting ATPase subunit alpha
MEGRIEEMLQNLETRAGQLQVAPSVQDIGRVLSVGDGVARVAGLPEAANNEIVVFENGTQGQVFDLDIEEAGCVLYGEEAGISAGSPVARTGRLASIPVGEEVLGRVISPLGLPLDGGEPLAGTEWRDLEMEAPGVLDRQPVREPLLSGIKAIDAAIPIGRGQRELILGDRETGKTSIALDTIINQRDTGVVCVYVSIGAKRASVRQLVDELSKLGALAHTVVVVADSSGPAALRYLAPYAGCSIAEWFAYRGRQALVVYDDLTHHAGAYRDISLLLRRPPTREAYPGDIFFAHARLMERAFKLSDARGGGSVTALPIIQTQRGNFSGFIPTNLISMTDGQIYLDTTLFAEGQLPAVDIGLSVSRVGGSAQPGSLREAAANVRIELSQYLEVKAFTRFGTLLDEATQRQLARGERLAMVLRQRERAPVSLAIEVAETWALKAGLLDDLTPGQIAELEPALISLQADFPQADALVVSGAGVTAELEQQLRRWVEAAKSLLPTGPVGRS